MKGAHHFGLSVGRARHMVSCRQRAHSIRSWVLIIKTNQTEAHIEAGAFQWLAQDGEILSRVRHAYHRLSASIFLRAANAIHLATAAEAGFRIIYSNDAHLLAAARHFGVEGKNVVV